MAKCLVWMCRVEVIFSFCEFPDQSFHCMVLSNLKQFSGKGSVKTTSEVVSSCLLISLGTVPILANLFDIITIWLN
jgi:hypothetical protein